MISAVFGLYNIRMSGIDEDVTDESREMMLNITLAFGEEEYYNISRQPPSDQENLAEKWLENPVNMVSAGSLWAVYNTPPFFIEPGGSVLSSSQTSFLKTSEGYFLSREIPESLIKIMYQSSRVKELNEKAANDSLSLEDWRTEIEKLRAIEMNETVAREVSKMNTEDSAKGVAYINDYRAPQLAEIYLEKGFKEVKWYHFLPGIAATIVIWYFINSVLVEFAAAIRELV